MQKEGHVRVYFTGMIRLDTFDLSWKIESNVSYLLSKLAMIIFATLLTVYSNSCFSGINRALKYSQEG